MGDDQPAGRRAKVDAGGTRRGITGIHAHRHGDVGILPGRRIGRLACGHGHDLHAHDHVPVIEDRAHEDQQQRQNKGELDKGLAFALPAHPAKMGKVSRFHGASLLYMARCWKLSSAGSFLTMAETRTG